MSRSSSPDYKTLFLKAEEERKQEAELRKKAEERRGKQRRERGRQRKGTGRQTKGEAGGERTQLTHDFWRVHPTLSRSSLAAAES
jgi:hypothetical protein